MLMMRIRSEKAEFVIIAASLAVITRTGFASGSYQQFT